MNQRNNYQSHLRSSSLSSSSSGYHHQMMQQQHSRHHSNQRPVNYHQSTAAISAPQSVNYLSTNHDNEDYDFNKDKLWYRKLKKALTVLEDDIYAKTIKMNELRHDISSIKSRSSRLIFKEVDDKLMQLKNRLDSFYSFFTEMNQLEVKYEAIVYDCDPNSSPNNGKGVKSSTVNAKTVTKELIPSTHDLITSDQSLSSRPPTPSIPNTISGTSGLGSSPAYQLTGASSPLMAYVSLNQQPSRQHNQHSDDLNLVSSPSSSFPPTPHCPTDGSISPSHENYISDQQERSSDYNVNLIKTPIKTINELHGYASPVPKRGSPRTRATPRKSFTPKRRGLTRDNQENLQYTQQPHHSSNFQNQQVASLGDPYSEPPSESGSSIFDDAFSSEDIHVKGDAIMEELINHPILHEKLAQTINRVFNVENIPHDTNTTEFIGSSDQYFDTNHHQLLPEASSPDRTFTEETNANEIQLPDTAIEDILNEIQSLPIFNDILDNCLTKKDIVATSTNGVQTHSQPVVSSSPPSSSSLALTTPKSSEVIFRSPLSTPIRNWRSDVVKDLMSDLKTPEKKQIPSSPLSIAIESSAIKDNTSISLPDSSPVLPVLDFSALISAQSIDQQQSPAQIFSGSTATTTYRAVLPRPDTPYTLQAGGTTYLITQTSGLINSSPSLSSSSMSNKNLAKKVLKGKRLNLDKFENYNSLGLKKRRSRELKPIATNIRRLAPKLTATVIEKVDDDLSSSNSRQLTQSNKKPSNSLSRSGVRVNLKHKFEENVNSDENSDKNSGNSSSKQELTNDKQQTDKDANCDKTNNKSSDLLTSQLLKNMNVDQFLSKIHEERS